MNVKLSILIILIFATIATHAKDEAPKIGDLAPDFILQDAEEKTHTLKKLRGKIVFLILGNRKIRKEDDKWAEAFKKDYQKNKNVIAYIIADMRSVPGFIPKRFIRSQVKKKPPPAKFLFDWKGEIHKKYHTEKKKPTLYLISQQGKIEFHRKTNFKPQIYAELKNKIDSLLKLKQDISR